MKTIEEIKQEIADEENAKKEPVINHEPDGELIEIRGILIRAIEEEVKETLKKDPDVIDIDISIDIWETIKNYNLQAYMRKHSEEVFVAVIKEIKAAGYTNVKCSSPADLYAFSIFHLRFMSHDMPKDKAETYRKMVWKESYANEGAVLFSMGTIFFGLVLFLAQFDQTTTENIAFLSKIVVAGILISIISIIKYRKAKKVRENMQEQILEKYRR